MVDANIMDVVATTDDCICRDSGPLGSLFSSPPPFGKPTHERYYAVILVSLSRAGGSIIRIAV